MYVRVKHVKASAVKNKYYIKNLQGFHNTLPHDNVEPLHTDLLTRKKSIQMQAFHGTTRKRKGFAISPPSPPTIPVTKYDPARLSDAACCKPTDLIGQWFPTSGCDTDQHRGGSGGRMREGFMEAS